MRYIIAHTKPSEGNVIVNGKPIRKEFYQESEWRYVPHGNDIKPYLKRETFDSEDDLLKENLKVRDRFKLKMSPSDIKYIFVKSDSDIPEIVNFIQTALDHFPAADVKLLTSRVTSLESITQDF